MSAQEHAVIKNAREVVPACVVQRYLQALERVVHATPGKLNTIHGGVTVAQRQRTHTTLLRRAQAECQRLRGGAP